MHDARFRIDFRFIDVSEDAGTPEYVPVPDPARYEYYKDANHEGYFDRIDPRRLFLPIGVVADVLRKAQTLALDDLQPTISDSRKYVESRAEAIRSGIDHGITDREFRNAADSDLESNAGSKTDFVVLSIDLVGSTRLSQAIDAAVYARIIQTYSSEIARACAHFHGRPLKFMGDGAILYFALGTFARRHDMAMDCALTLRDLVLLGINPALEERGLFPLACRIGADSGEAFVMTIGDSGTTNHIDIIGEVVNIATKIEKATPKNGICVGESILINTHTIWAKSMKRIPIPKEWPYRQRATADPYPVYLLDVPADGPI